MLDTMTQFHEGQEVEVWKEVRARGTDLHQNFVRRWCKAKIVARASDAPVTRNRQWAVQFPDGTRVVFDVEHIRAIDDHAARMLIRDRQNNPYLPPLSP